jgi:hypothetical protein
MTARELRISCVGIEPGVVEVWALPLWFKGDKLVAARMTPQEARRLSLRLLLAAEGAEELPR